MRGGVYVLDDPDRPMCLPLEAVLLGERGSGGFEADLGRLLGVSREWVGGFLAGFALGPGVDPSRPGYQDGVAFRMKHYPSERL
jgi:hypothetical protein